MSMYFCGNCDRPVEQHKLTMHSEHTEKPTGVQYMWVHVTFKNGADGQPAYYLNCSDVDSNKMPEFHGTAAEPEFYQDQII